MSAIYNHMIFLTENERNNLHLGKEVKGEGFVTIINHSKVNLNFYDVTELIGRYRINSTSKKSETVLKINIKDSFDNDDHILINFNPIKLKINIDDILNVENNGKEKIKFTIIDKNSISYICIADIKSLNENYVFIDEINNSLEPSKT